MALFLGTSAAWAQGSGKISAPVFKAQSFEENSRQISQNDRESLSFKDFRQGTWTVIFAEPTEAKAMKVYLHPSFGPLTLSVGSQEHKVTVVTPENYPATFAQPKAEIHEQQLLLKLGNWDIFSVQDPRVAAVYVDKAGQEISDEIRASSAMSFVVTSAPPIQIPSLLGVKKRPQALSYWLTNLMKETVLAAGAEAQYSLAVAVVYPLAGRNVTTEIPVLLMPAKKFDVSDVKALAEGIEEKARIILAGVPDYDLVFDLKVFKGTTVLSLDNLGLDDDDFTWK